MLKQEESGGGGGGGGDGGVGSRSNNWSRTCDTCRSSPSTVYCRADSAYLCTSCDARIHAVNTVASRHERVWVCEACERAPAAFLCKADAASLCTTCDSDIHSANPLASRHQRVPILPIPGVLYGPPARSNHIIRHSTTEDEGFLNQEAEEETIIDEDEAASWLLLDPLKNSSHHQGNTSGMQFDGEVVDEYLDLVDYNANNHENQFIDINCNIEDQKQYNLLGQQNFFEGDGMVPNRLREPNHNHDHQLQIQHHHHHHQNFNLGLQFESYPASTSYTNQVAVSCMDVMVPQTAMADFSNTSQPITSSKGTTTIDLFSNPSIQMPQQLNPMDREARVLRYREKKKARKFEKTIRYASRKAYAETRPRIKGRFAKRTNTDVEVDQVLLSQATGYGVVPSF